MKHIGIVCEGPTDYIILKGVIDQITGDQNTYVMLQPEDDLTGKYGNGWKGVWKWCNDHASIRKELMKDIPYVYEVLKKGSEKAESVAAATLARVKNAMRINYFEDEELIRTQAEQMK